MSHTSLRNESLAEKKREDPSPSSDSHRLSIDTQSDTDGIEPANIDSFGQEAVQDEKADRPQSTTSKRPTLSRVASRLTTRSIVDPGPAPDGGLKAWTQIAAGWLATLTTWGWVNCFGELACQCAVSNVR